MFEFIIALAIFILIYVILAITLNLVVGYTGLLSVAHAAFYGIGAYTTAILLRQFDINFFVALVAAIVITAGVALLIGLVLSKFSGDYYALASLGFTTIVYSVFLNWDILTRGPRGIPGIARPEVFGISFASNTSFLLLAAGLTIIVYLLAKAISRSSFGRVLKAIREDEQALAVFGYKTQLFKLVIFVTSAGLAAIAGALYATYVTFIDPSTFTVLESVLILAMIILGGLASLRGSIIGAAVLIALPEALRFVGFSPSIAAELRQVVYGLLLIILMLYRPQGVMGEYKL